MVGNSIGHLFELNGVKGIEGTALRFYQGNILLSKFKDMELLQRFLSSFILYVIFSFLFNIYQLAITCNLWTRLILDWTERTE